MINLFKRPDRVSKFIYKGLIKLLSKLKGSIFDYVPTSNDYFENLGILINRLLSCEDDICDQFSGYYTVMDLMAKILSIKIDVIMVENKRSGEIENFFKKDEVSDFRKFYRDYQLVNYCFPNLNIKGGFYLSPSFKYVSEYLNGNSNLTELRRKYNDSSYVKDITTQFLDGNKFKKIEKVYDGFIVDVDYSEKGPETDHMARQREDETTENKIKPYFIATSQESFINKFILGK